VDNKEEESFGKQRYREIQLLDNSHTSEKAEQRKKENEYKQEELSGRRK
jgi:hypothetical protein